MTGIPKSCSYTWNPPPDRVMYWGYGCYLETGQYRIQGFLGLIEGLEFRYECFRV